MQLVSAWLTKFGDELKGLVLAGDGFTLTGDATLTWQGSPPSQSRLAFQIKVGNAPTVAVEEETWSAVKGLYEGR